MSSDQDTSEVQCRRDETNTGQKMVRVQGETPRRRIQDRKGTDGGGEQKDKHAPVGGGRGGSGTAAGYAAGTKAQAEQVRQEDRSEGRPAVRVGSSDRLLVPLVLEAGLSKLLSDKYRSKKRLWYSDVPGSS